MVVEYDDGLSVDWSPAEMRKIEAYRKEAARRRENDVRLEALGGGEGQFSSKGAKREWRALLHDIATDRAKAAWRGVWEDVRRMMR